VYMCGRLTLYYYLSHHQGLPKDHAQPWTEFNVYWVFADHAGGPHTILTENLQLESVMTLFCSVPSTQTSARAGHSRNELDLLPLDRAVRICCGGAMTGLVCYRAVGQLPRAGAPGQLPHQRLGHGAV
jgi:hypothetical protein